MRKRCQHGDDDTGSMKPDAAPLSPPAGNRRPSDGLSCAALPSAGSRHDGSPESHQEAKRSNNCTPPPPQEEMGAQDQQQQEEGGLECDQEGPRSNDNSIAAAQEEADVLALQPEEQVEGGPLSLACKVAVGVFVEEEEVAQEEIMDPKALPSWVSSELMEAQRLRLQELEDRAMCVRLVMEEQRQQQHNENEQTANDVVESILTPVQPAESQDGDDKNDETLSQGSNEATRMARQEEIVERTTASAEAMEAGEKPQETAPQDADNDDDNEDSFLFGLVSSKYFYDVAAVVGLVVAAAIVVWVAFALLGGGNDDENGESGDNETNAPTPLPTTHETNAPTPLPTTQPSGQPTSSPTITFSPRFERVFELLGPTLAADYDVATLRDTASKQHWALQWLSDEDPAELDFARTPEQVLIERYVMALLYNSTGGGETWIQELDFLTARETCQWREMLFQGLGVHCSGQTIREIRLSENGLKGTLPTELGLVTGLTFLHVADNLIRGTFPVFASRLPNLGRLWISLNAFTGTIPTEIAAFQTLWGLDFAQNRFVGTIPTEIGLMRSLRGIAFAENMLRGTIPTEIGLLSNTLELFIVHESALTGEIPTEIGYLRLMEFLDMSGNEFAGRIPTELGMLTNSRNMRFSGNNLSGEIPSELARLTRLEYLRLHDNLGITGTVPTEFARLTRLIGFDVHHTALTGGIEWAMCEEILSVRFTPFEFMIADCWGDAPQIQCSCCTTCCRHTGVETVFPVCFQP